MKKKSYVLACLGQKHFFYCLKQKYLQRWFGFQELSFEFFL